MGARQLLARIEIAALEPGPLPEAGQIMNADAAPAHGDQSLLAQLPQDAINMDGGQPQGISEHELGQRALELG